MSATCCVCPASPFVVFRVVPRRDVPPITDEVRRALAWPGTAAPVDIPACRSAEHQTRARRSGLVLEVRPLTDEVQAIQVKDDGGQGV